MAWCLIAALIPISAWSSSTDPGYRSLGGLGVAASAASVSGRRLSVTIAATRAVRLRLAVVQGRVVRATARPRTIRKGTQTVVEELRSTVVGTGLRLRVTAYRGADRARQTIKLKIRSADAAPQQHLPAPSPLPVAPAPPVVPATPAGVAASGPCGRTESPPTVYDHVVWIVMENHSYSDIIGSAAAPYVNQLASACGQAAAFFAEAHPSLPNYIAMTSGSIQGITDDAPPASHPLTAASIFSLVGTDWRALQESMPSNCLLTDAGRYAVRHNPAAYYTNIRAACAARDVPLGSTPDLSARFTFVTPNLCSDTHDCSVQDGDNWLSNFFSQVFASAEYQADRTAIFLTWDEDDYTSSNQIATLVVAPSVRPGTTSATRFDHYSLLRTTEEMLGLSPLLGNAATAPSMRGEFGL